MSHVSSIELEISDLSILQHACERLGFSFLANQTSFAWYGTHVGDWPLPEGFKKEDMGKCLHAIDVGAKSGYQIGVCRNPKNPKAYTLLWDFWKGGGLTEVVGEKAEKIVNAYGVEKASKAMKKAGYSVYEKQDEQGRVTLKCVKR